MTNEEALNWFKDDLKNGKCSDECPQCNAMERAIEALEKQILKKPILEGDGYDDTDTCVLIYDTWICPNCDKHYEVDFDEYDYCPICGQAIDWSDTE